MYKYIGGEKIHTIFILSNNYSKIPPYMKANNKKIKDIKNIKISVESHQLLKKYCKKHGLKMFAFIELLIKEKCKSARDIYGE